MRARTRLLEGSSILTAPDPRLTAVSEPVARVDDEIKKLMDGRSVTCKS